MARFQLGLLQFTCGRVAVAMMTWQPLANLPESSALQRFVHAFAALAQDQFAAARALFVQGIEASVDNAPLNTDMRMMIDRIDALQMASAAQSSPSGTAPEVVPAESDDQHVLLSNYQRQGPTH